MGYSSGKNTSKLNVPLSNGDYKNMALHIRPVYNFIHCFRPYPCGCIQGMRANYSLQ